MIIILNGMRQNLSEVFIYILLIFYCVCLNFHTLKNASVCPLFLIVSLLSFLSSLQILDSNPLPDVKFANSLSHSVSC